MTSSPKNTSPVARCFAARASPSRLPLLDSMIPAQTPLAKTAASPKTRFTGIFVPHGMASRLVDSRGGGPGEPKRANPGDPFEFPMIMKPLEPLPRSTSSS